MAVPHLDVGRTDDPAQSAVNIACESTALLRSERKISIGNTADEAGRKLLKPNESLRRRTKSPTGNRRLLLDQDTFVSSWMSTGPIAFITSAVFFGYTGKTPASRRSSMEHPPSLHPDSDATSYVRSSPSPKKLSRPRTYFSFTHQPPPVGAEKLVLRRKRVLQLQLTKNNRPVPTYDVVTSSLISVTMARLLKKKSALGPKDIAVVQCEHISQAQRSRENDGDCREEVGIICHLSELREPGSKLVDISLDNGERWEGRAFGKSSYELCTLNDEGIQTKVRWTVKPIKNRVFSPITKSSSHVPEVDKRFAFSTIDSNSRRHPIIAYITAVGLEVFDDYSMPAPAPRIQSPSSVPKSSREDSIYSSEGTSSTASTEPPIQTNEDLRKLIVISGIWVALREGWSPGFAYSGSEHGSPVSPKSLKGLLSRKTFSMPNTPTRSSSSNVLTSTTSKMSSKPVVSRTNSDSPRATQSSPTLRAGGRERAQTVDAVNAVSSSVPLSSSRVPSNHSQTLLDEGNELRRGNRSITDGAASGSHSLASLTNETSKLAETVGHGRGQAFRRKLKRLLSCRSGYD